MPTLGEARDGLRVSGRAGPALDAIGLALVLTAAAWAFVSAAVAGGSAAPVAGVVLGSAAALVVGRVVGWFRRPAVPALICLAAGVVMLAPGTFDRRPLQGPFGYANAAGGFFALACVAGLMVAFAARTRASRIAGIAAAAAFALVLVVRGSLAPAALLVLGPAALLLARDARGVRLVVAGCAALFLLTLAGTAAIGATSNADEGRPSSAGVVERALSVRRVTLWHDALSIMAAHPLVGVGPGRFAEESEVARGDVDASRAHQEFLQQGAEEGIPGLAVAVAVVLWGFAALWVTRPADRFTALGAAALAVVAVHACVDYVLHFAAIPIVGAALVGAAQASGSRPDARRAELATPTAAPVNGDR